MGGGWTQRRALRSWRRAVIHQMQLCRRLHTLSSPSQMQSGAMPCTSCSSSTRSQGPRALRKYYVETHLLRASKITGRQGTPLFVRGEAPGAAGGPISESRAEFENARHDERAGLQGGQAVPVTGQLRVRRRHHGAISQLATELPTHDGAAKERRSSHRIICRKASRLGGGLFRGERAFRRRQ